MGLPTVAMGVLGALISPLAAASLLIVPSFVTNVWQLFAGPNVSVLVRRLWPMMLAVVVGTIAGSSLLTSGDTMLTTSALGGALVLYAGYTLVARQVRVPAMLEPVSVSRHRRSNRPDHRGHRRLRHPGRALPSGTRS